MTYARRLDFSHQMGYNGQKNSGKANRCKMSRLTDRIEKEIVIYDGSKGSVLMAHGLMSGEDADIWCVDHPDVVRKLHEDYIEAGSGAIQTNTFMANEMSLKEYGLSERTEEINRAGARLALEAAGDNADVAASVGPLPKLMRPYGDLSVRDAVKVYERQLRALMSAGIETVHFETFTDLAMMRAALIAANNTGITAIATLSFDQGRTLAGNTPEACAVTLKALGARAVGANCSGGPDSLMDPIKRMNSVVGIPLIVKPNAGLPKKEGDMLIYSMGPEDFRKDAAGFINNGVRLIGGCCGTDAAFIKALREELSGLKAPAIAVKEELIASPYKAGRVPDELLSVTVTGGDDPYDVMDEADGESVMLCFSDIGPEEASSFVLDLSVIYKEPLVIKADDDRVFEAVLRDYPGRAGAVPGNAGQEKAAAAFGALVVSE